MEFDAQFWSIVKVAGAMLLGGFIGLEREIAGKPAGLRTHMLVTGSSALLVVLGDYMIQYYGSSSFIEAIQTDPIRIIEAIVTGISFLGAGTIIFRSGEEVVEGLTTAASILFASAIGIAVALDQFLMAAVLTLMVIMILFALGYIEGWIKSLRERLP
ncbi:MAG TPA: MgtC/SapB family protein [Halalkalibaculum sp.]|nr:MgtC/SapB family protein [Halalkalibaculum sp.]